MQRKVAAKGCDTHDFKSFPISLQSRENVHYVLFYQERMLTMFSSIKRECSLCSLQSRENAHYVLFNQERMFTMFSSINRECSLCSLQSRENAHYVLFSQEKMLTILICCV